MRKSIISNVVSLVICLVFVLNAGAQDDKPAKFGIRAGWHYAAMFKDGDMLSGTDRINSFYLGVFKEKKIIPLLRFGSGLEYFKNGYKINDNINREINYLSIPLYLKVKIGPVYGTGGTGLNIKVSEKLPGSNLLDPLNDEKTGVLDIPLQLGVGLKILFISAEVRYYWGMIDLKYGAKNQYLQAGLTFSF